jgi:hypothetical protein
MNKTDVSSDARNYALIISNGFGNTMKFIGVSAGVYSIGRGIIGVVDSFPDPVSITGYGSSILIGTTLGGVLFVEGSKYIKKSQENISVIGKDYLEKASSKESIDKLVNDYRGTSIVRVPL